MHLFLLGEAFSFCHLGVPLHSTTALQLLLALHLQDQRLSVLPVCVCRARSHPQPSPAGSALGSSLKSQPIEMARGALMCSSALTWVSLTLGEFSVLFSPNGPILHLSLVVSYFPFPLQALQGNNVDNRLLNLCVHGSSEVSVWRSPDQHRGGLWPCLEHPSCAGLKAMVLPHAQGRLHCQEDSVSQQTHTQSSVVFLLWQHQVDEAIIIIIQIWSCFLHYLLVLYLLEEKLCVYVNILAPLSCAIALGGGQDFTHCICFSTSELCLFTKPPSELL